MTQQTTLEMPRDLKQTRVTLKLNQADREALTAGMDRVGETNMSSYIRRLIHENKRR
jgi:S-adenosylmethionine:tRNA-ribosyltransferase-isomerase (queuine synthetase)